MRSHVPNEKLLHPLPPRPGVFCPKKNLRLNTFCIQLSKNFSWHRCADRPSHDLPIVHTGENVCVIRGKDRIVRNSRPQATTESGDLSGGDITTTPWLCSAAVTSCDLSLTERERKHALLLGGSSSFSMAPVSVLQRITRPFFPPVATCLASGGRKVIAYSVLRVNPQGCAGDVTRAGSQIVAVPSQLAVAISSPSGLMSTSSTRIFMSQGVSILEHRRCKLKRRNRPNLGASIITCRDYEIATR